MVSQICIPLSTHKVSEDVVKDDFIESETKLGQNEGTPFNQMLCKEIEKMHVIFKKVFLNSDKFKQIVFQGCEIVITASKHAVTS